MANLFSAETEELVHNLYDRLGSSRLLCVAESCTGGLLGAALTSVAGSSEYFSGGIIAYENQVKRKVLAVEEQSLAAEGAVSATVAAEMVEGVCDVFDVDVGVSVTGIAGPGGGTEDKPVGLVFAGFGIGAQLVVEKCYFSGSRAENRRETVQFVLSRLSELL